MKAAVLIGVFSLLFILAAPSYALSTLNIPSNHIEAIQQNGTTHYSFVFDTTNLNANESWYFYSLQVPTGVSYAFSQDKLLIPNSTTRQNAFTITLPPNYFGQLSLTLFATPTLENTTYQANASVTANIPAVNVQGYNVQSPSNFTWGGSIILPLIQSNTTCIQLDTSLLYQILSSKDETASCNNRLSSISVDQANTYTKYLQEKDRADSVQTRYNDVASEKTVWMWLAIICLIGFAAYFLWERAQIGA